MFSVPCITGQAGSFYTAAGGCERAERAGSSASLLSLSVSRALVGACASSAESLRRGCGQAEVTAVSPAGLQGGGRRRGGGGKVGRQAESVRWESAQEESLVAVLAMESPRLLRLLLSSFFGSVLLFFSAGNGEHGPPRAPLAILTPPPRHAVGEGSRLFPSPPCLGSERFFRGNPEEVWEQRR